MTLVEDRPRHTPQADTEGWLAAFEAERCCKYRKETNIVTTINGNSRQNLGNFGCWGGGGWVGGEDGPLGGADRRLDPTSKHALQLRKSGLRPCAAR